MINLIISRILNMRYIFLYMILTSILVFLTLRITLFISEDGLFWPVNGIILAIMFQSGTLYRSIVILIVGCFMTAFSRLDTLELDLGLKLSIATFFEISLSSLMLNYFVFTKHMDFLSYEFILKLIISVSTVSCFVGASIGAYVLFWEVDADYFDTTVDWFTGDLTGNFITLYTFFSVRHYWSNRNKLIFKLSNLKKYNHLHIFYIVFILTPLSCTYYIKKIETTPSIAIIMIMTPLVSTVGLVFENIIVSLFNLFVLFSVTFGTSNKRGPIYNLLSHIDTRDVFICVEMVLLSIFMLSYIFSIQRNSNIQKQNHLTELLEEKGKLIEEKDIFFSYISHELRTPLSVIYGYTENLLNHGDIESQSSNDIKCIMDASVSMKATINDLLLVFNIEEKSYIVNIIEVDIRQFCNNILSFLLQINDKNLKITLEIDNELPEFVGTDPVRLRQLIMNVGYNAIKYTDSEGSIHLLFSTVGDNLKITIKDSGVGISDSDIGKIFDRFYRSSVTQDREGIGLGLPMCKNICKVLHGDIYVESKVGIGSIFTIIIPNNHISEKKPSSILLGKKDMSKYRILIIEDSVPNYKLLERILHIDNYTVEIIKDGSIAMEKIISVDYDMILLDLGLPGRSGLDILKDIKNHESPSINMTPVIIISAEVGIDTRNKCIENKCLGFLDKPFDEKAIRSKLYDYLEKSF